MPYNVVVFEENIVRLIQAGDGHRWIKKKATAIRNTAVVLAPHRTYALRASHIVTQNRNAGGRFQTGFIVSATARHAAWVHGGTGPTIRPKHGSYMVLPGRNPNPGRTQGRGERTVVTSVRGQRPNPWLLRAARRHT